MCNNGRHDENQRLHRIYDSFQENISPIAKLDRWNEFVCEVYFLKMSQANLISYIFSNFPNRTTLTRRYKNWIRPLLNSSHC